MGTEEKLQGIYIIKNTETNRVYVGRSSDIRKRWREHQKALESGTHHSTKLQEAYDELQDKSHMVYQIVELSNNPNLIPDMEQHYYDVYDSYNNGYNMCPLADNPKYKTSCGGRSFIFFSDWYDMIVDIENIYNRDTANKVARQLIKYGVTRETNDDNPAINIIAQKMFIEWLDYDEKYIDEIKQILTPQ